MRWSRALRTSISLFLVGVGAAAGQAVQGVVRDEARGRPIAGARLLLLGDAGTPVDSALADTAGHFRLAARAPGIYTLYFHLDGYTGVPSDALQLEAGVTTRYEFRVPLIPSATLQQMSDIIALDPRLQKPLPELCGEAFRAREAGFLVGVVRQRASGAPIAGARVSGAGADGRPIANVSSDRGIYFLCNLPAGPAVTIITVSPNGSVDTTRVEIRAGTVAWFDLVIGK